MVSRLCAMSRASRDDPLRFVLKCLCVDVDNRRCDSSERRSTKRLMRRSNSMHCLARNLSPCTHNSSQPSFARSKRLGSDCHGCSSTYAHARTSQLLPGRPNRRIQCIPIQLGETHTQTTPRTQAGAHARATASAVATASASRLAETMRRRFRHHVRVGLNEID